MAFYIANARAEVKLGLRNLMDKSRSNDPKPKLSRREFVAATAILGAVAATDKSLRAAEQPRATGAQAMNENQTVKMPVANRAPLLQTPFVALPLGSIRARG